MAQHCPTNFLLTGRPSIGKTTVIRRFVELNSDKNLSGFYTDELREQGRRTGFRIITLDGVAGILAHHNANSRFRVGKYRVNVEEFEELVLPRLDPTITNPALFIIDEIGKMECFSQRFVSGVRRLLDSATPVLATVAQKGGGFISEVRARSDVRLIQITTQNRDQLPLEVSRMIFGRIKKK
jgi:nucleoside-triphosphatase